jgi:hypothetical protein
VRWGGGGEFLLSYDGGDSGSEECKGGYDGAYGGVWRSLKTAVRVCVCVYKHICLG